MYKDLHSTDVSAFQKIPTKQGFYDFVLFPLFWCIRDQPMGCKGIWRPQNFLKGKGYVLLCTDSEELLFHPPKNLQTPKLGLQIGGPIHSIERHGRIQLERTPH